MTPLDSRTIAPGTTLFERYVVIEALGAGSSGAVYHCEDTRVRSVHIALKLIPISVLGDPAAATRLGREVRIGNKIDHQNVVRLYDCLRDEMFIGLVLEHVDGAPICRPTGVALEQVARWLVPLMIQTCHGLEAIHKAKILHRDLKPLNLIVTHDARIKIADLGLAKFAHLAKGDSTVADALKEYAYERHATWAGDVVGTFDYLPPEYLVRCEFDERGDQYAFGICAYELLTGQLPYRGPSLVAMIQAKVEDRREPGPNTADAFTVALLGILGRMIDPRPQARFESVAAVREALQELPTGGVSSGPKTTPARENAPVLRNTVAASARHAGRWIVGLMLGLMALFVLLAWIRAFQSSPSVGVSPVDKAKKSRFFGPAAGNTPGK